MGPLLIQAKLVPLTAGALAALALLLGACGPASPSTAAPGATETGGVLQQEAAGAPEPPPATSVATVATPAAPTTTPTSGAVPVANLTSTPTTTVSATIDQPAAQIAPAPESVETLVADLAEDAWDFLVTLTAEFSPRESATEEEKVAAEYLIGEFRALGLEAVLQPFTVDLLSTDPPVLSLDAPEHRAIQGFPMRLSGTGTGSGILVDVGKAFQEDLPAEGMHGKIALIQRGTITFQQKVERVADAGAVAAVVYNNVPGGFGGRLATQASIPAIAISRESGADIRELMAGGEITATVSVVIEAHDSRNVIAELPGTADDGRVVVLGGHYDTVADTQGADDNGSGIATLITLAREVSQTQFPFTVRFIAFGSEEVGLFGSKHYVGSLSSDERQSIIAMLNFDVPGSGSVLEAIGSADLVDQAMQYADEHGLAVERGTSLELEGATSDHAPFSEVGIPVLFFPADDLSRINSPDDTIEFVNPELLGTAAALGLALLDSLAGR